MGVTKAVRSFNATSLYTRESAITSHRLHISESLKESKKDTESWDPLST